jgi:hypothetical protein
MPKLASGHVLRGSDRLNGVCCGMVEISFVMRFRAQKQSEKKSKRATQRNTYDLTIICNLAYVVKMRVGHKPRLYLVCSVLDLIALLRAPSLFLLQQNALKFDLSGVVGRNKYGTFKNSYK